MKRALVLFIGALLVPAGVFAADSIRDGYWEVTSQTEMPGMSMKMPPSTMKVCYTKDDVKNQRKLVSQNKDCKMTEYKMSGNKATFAMKCTGKSAMTLNGEMIFSGSDAYTTSMKMNSAGHIISVKAKARRIGNCP